MKNSILVAGSGYTLRSYVMALVGNPDTVIDPLSGIQNTVERSYGDWKRRFPILATGINVKITSSQSIIVICSYCSTP